MSAAELYQSFLLLYQLPEHCVVYIIVNESLGYVLLPEPTAIMSGTTEEKKTSPSKVLWEKDDPNNPFPGATVTRSASPQTIPTSSLQFGSIDGDTYAYPAKLGETAAPTLQELENEHDTTFDEYKERQKKVENMRFQGQITLINLDCCTTYINTLDQEVGKELAKLEVLDEVCVYTHR